MKFHCYCFLPTPTIYRRLESGLEWNVGDWP